jgi:hypothetical protein
MFFLKSENWETLFVGFWNMFVRLVIMRWKTKYYYMQGVNYRELVEAYYSLKSYNGSISFFQRIQSILYCWWILKMIKKTRVSLVDYYFFIEGKTYDISYYFTPTGIVKEGNRVRFRFITYKDVKLELIEDFLDHNKTLVSVKRF